ncbi:MAG: VOC family protein [Gammaproteobacteria bacterium]|nr:VOC family protein [Gammaproteobacteria bacterium]
MIFNVARIHHVSFLISDLDRAERFYCGTLGLHKVERPELGYPGLWLQINQEQQIHLMQLPNPDAGRQPPPHGGRDRHIALHVQGLDELAKELDALGWEYTLSRSGRKALFCRDTDGNALEFIQQDETQSS